MDSFALERLVRPAITVIAHELIGPAERVDLGLAELLLEAKVGAGDGSCARELEGAALFGEVCGLPELEGQARVEELPVERRRLPSAQLH